MGDWTGFAEQLALRVGDSWHFVAPADGVEVFDKAAQLKRIYASGWITGTVPDVPTGGDVIDLEARAAITELISTLQTIGILGDPA